MVFNSKGLHGIDAALRKRNKEKTLCEFGAVCGHPHFGHASNLVQIFNLSIDRCQLTELAELASFSDMKGIEDQLRKAIAECGQNQLAVCKATGIDSGVLSRF